MGLELNQVTGTVGGTVATDTVGDHFQVVKTAFGGAGVVTRVSSSTPLPVTGTTDAPLPVTIQNGTVGVVGTVTISGVTTVSGTVGVSGTVTVAGAVTASGTVGVSGTVMVAGAVTASGTVGVTGTVTVDGAITASGTVSLTGTLPGPVRNTLAIVQAGSADKVLGSAGGTGDYLSHLTIVMGSTASGTVSIADNLRGTHIVFGSGQSNVPYTVAVLAHSKFGPWRVSAGTGVTVMATGVFTD